MQIRKLDPTENYPLELLLLADPSERRVAAYTKQGTCYVGELQGKIVGVYVLLPTRPGTIELVNIAVAEGMQGRGFGSQLLQHAIQTSRSSGCKTIEVGTGNSSIGQLAFYQKCGFRIVGVERNFFVIHYPEPIFENGIQCKDMVRLSLDL